MSEFSKLSALISVSNTNCWFILSNNFLAPKNIQLISITLLTSQLLLFVEGKDDGCVDGENNGLVFISLLNLIF